jgi:hypothetical protein
MRHTLYHCVTFINSLRFGTLEASWLDLSTISVIEYTWLREEISIGGVSRAGF